MGACHGIQAESSAQLGIAHVMLFCVKPEVLVWHRISIFCLPPFSAFLHFLPSSISCLPPFLAFLAALADRLFRVSGTPLISLTLLSVRCFDTAHIPYLHDCFILIKNYGCVRLVVNQIGNPPAVIIITQYTLYYYSF